MDEKFYDQLRNKEQLGYYVSASHRTTRGVNGVLFIIESAEYDPLYLEQRIQKFIKDTYEIVKSDENVYKEFYDGLLSRKKIGFKDIKEEASYLLGQMKDFSREQQPIDWDRAI